MTDDKPATADAEPTTAHKGAELTAEHQNAERTTVHNDAEPTTEPVAERKTEPTTAAADKAEETTPAKHEPAKPRRNVKQRADVPATPKRTVETAVESDPDESGGRDGWRRVGAVAIVLVAAFAVVVLWARPAHEPAPPVAQRSSSAPPAVTVLNPTDIAYLQLMISLDTSAMQLFDLIITSGDPVLGPVARSAAEGHRAELAALRKALADGGAIEDSSIHAGHDLPGMVVDADMAAIRAVPVAQQPAKALEVLREHLTGTTALCGSEAKNGADPATKAAAEQVLAAHGKLLAQLPAT